jgi:hypothetical protein
MAANRAVNKRRICRMCPYGELDPVVCEQVCKPAFTDGFIKGAYYQRGQDVSLKNRQK